MTNGTSDSTTDDCCVGKPLSTLSEINQELQLRMFELLNFVLPWEWVDPGQVIYSPRDDLDYASQIYQLKYPNNTGSIKLPFAYFTRSTTEVVERTYDQALRPWCPPISTQPPEPQSDWQVTVIPAIFLYVLRVYDYKVEYTEALLDGLYRKGIREKTTVYEYDSPTLHILSPYRIELGNPRYDRVPNLPDRLKGKGTLLSIVLPFECRCILGESQPATRIYEIPLTFNSPLCPPTMELDRVVIDSNTPIKNDRPPPLLTTQKGNPIATEGKIPVPLEVEVNK
jgi:hypothetical protein